MVPHDNVDSGKVIATPFVFDPPDAAGKFVALFVTDTLAYPPELGSVNPVPASAGVVVDNAQYHVPGTERATPPNQASKFKFSLVVVPDIKYSSLLNLKNK
jgi:hypothetical protein